MGGLNVVALISGGKDSLFSMLHCQANRHTVVALANLFPSQDTAVDDLESYMYQTIGHAVIPLYEQVLGLPLYRQEITGTASNQSKTYSPTDPTDETESLLPLLRKVLAGHPEVNAVSTGAILSDYQRTRVESVALRLGLTPLSYLWQWPSLPPTTQTSLLEDMLAVGQDSRIVKTASGGLDDTFLWQNVADPRTITRLVKAANKFGTAGDGAVLGEGGEFETLAVNGPGPLWKGRIAIPPHGVVTVAGEAGSFSVKISEPQVVLDAPSRTISNLRVPPLLDSLSERIMEKLSLLSDTSMDLTVSYSEELYGFMMCENEEVLKLSNVVGTGADATAQTHSIMNKISEELDLAEHDLNMVVYSTLILRDMALFAEVNAVYGTYFSRPNPPARLTVACADALPAGALLSIGITSVPGPKEGLHVQSRSYWAPANIGPYSQAISIPLQEGKVANGGAAYVAGQIPLVPATMEISFAGLPNTDAFTMQAVLALQHLRRIGRVVKVRQWICGVCFITAPFDGGETLLHRNIKARRVWHAFHEPFKIVDENASVEAEDFDVWHATYGAGNTPWRKADHAAEQDHVNETSVPPLVVLAVDSLPRGADVEWVGFGGTSTRPECPMPFHLASISRPLEHRLCLEGGVTWRDLDLPST